MIRQMMVVSIILLLSLNLVFSYPMGNPTPYPIKEISYPKGNPQPYPVNNISYPIKNLSYPIGNPQPYPIKNFSIPYNETNKKNIFSTIFNSIGKFFSDLFKY